MMIERYKIEYLPSFYYELNEILYYIKYILCNRYAAENLLNRIRKCIKIRALNPKINGICYNSKYKWYRIFVNNFIIFYTVSEDCIKVAHIVYNKRDYNKFF